MCCTQIPRILRVPWHWGYCSDPRWAILDWNWVRQYDVGLHLVRWGEVGVGLSNYVYRYQRWIKTWRTPNFKILYLRTRGMVAIVVSNWQFLKKPKLRKKNFHKSKDKDDLSFNVRWVFWQSLHITDSAGLKRYSGHSFFVFPEYI